MKMNETQDNVNEVKVWAKIEQLLATTVFGHSTM